MNIFRIIYATHIAIFSVFLTMNASEKVLIVTHVFNRPDLIELHKKTFDEFLEEDYQYVVFNDAPNEDMKQRMERTCNKVGATCIRVPQDLHKTPRDPSICYADSLQYAVDTIIKNYDGMVLMIEADMFLVRPFSLVNYLKEYDLIGCYQSRVAREIRVVYTLPALVFWNMKTAPNKHLINFKLGKVDGVATDTGGHMHYYLKNNPTLRYRLYDPYSEAYLPRDVNELQLLGFDDLCIKFLLSLLPVGKYFFEFHADNNFLHYRSGGSNWRGSPEVYLREKDTFLHDFINHSIQYHRMKKIESAKRAEHI